MLVSCENMTFTLSTTEYFCGCIIIFQNKKHQVTHTTYSI